MDITADKELTCLTISCQFLAASKRVKVEVEKFQNIFWNRHGIYHRKSLEFLSYLSPLPFPFAPRGSVFELFKKHCVLHFLIGFFSQGTPIIINCYI